MAALPAPVSIEVKYDTGSLTKTNSAGNWAQTWASSDTEHGLVIDVSANNMPVRTTGNLEIYAGQSGRANITFTTADEWYVSAYSFTATATEGSLTLTHNGTESTLDATHSAEVSETFTVGQDPSMVLAGSNKGVTFSDFTVVLSYRDPADYALSVDQAPADETYAGMAVTNIVGDHFNTFTTWYHLMNGKSFFTGASLADAGTNRENAYGDEYLYCVVKTDAGYALYNKGAGVATAVNGAVLTSDKVTANGADVDAYFAQKFVPVTVEGGSMTREDNNATNMWRSTWTSSTEPTVTFSGSKNNMSTTDSQSTYVPTGDFRLETGSASGGDFTWSFGGGLTNYISDYTFLARKESTDADDCKITPNGGAQVTLTDYNKRISASGFDDTKTASFVQNAKNLKGMIISDVYVTVRRLLANYCDRIGQPIFFNEGVERRIPAIACVAKGEHAGRLVAIFDYRHNGGDIGFNGNISLEIAVSDDNGATWSEPDYCRDADGNAVTTFPADLAVSNHNMAYYQADPNQYWNFAFGDAAIVADRESDRLLMLAVGGPTSLWNGRYDKPNQCVRWYSEDGGDTWTPAQRITYDILDLFNGEPQFGKIDSHFIGSGRIMQSRYVKVGEYYRLYAVTATQNNGAQGTTRNYVLYSDDFGMTWAVLGGNDVCPVATGDGDECKAEELPDGSVLIAGRRRTGNRNFNIFRYTDATDGQGVWTGQTVTNMGFGSINACNGEIMILPAKDNVSGEACYLALQSFPYGGGRNYVSIAYKGLKTGADIATSASFTTWEGRYRVSDRASVYSTMAWQADNKLAFFYEEYRPRISGYYLNFTLEEITDGQYSYLPDAGNRTAIRMTEELLEIRSKEDMTSKYVGQPIRSDDLFEQSIDAYYDAPSYRAYVKANKLQYEGNGLIPVVNNGGYRLISAHNGTYNLDGDRFLATDGSTLTASPTDENNTFKAIESNGNYKLYNAARGVYVANTPAATNTSVPVTTNADEAGEYSIVSAFSGQSNLTCVNPGHGTYGSLHMDGSQKIVIWSAGAQASQWYMELVDVPDGYQVPEATEPAYDDYDFDYEKNEPVGPANSISEVVVPVADECYFDLQGRRVAKPSHGIFISNTGRKVAF